MKRTDPDAVGAVQILLRSPVEDRIAHRTTSSFFRCALRSSLSLQKTEEESDGERSEGEDEGAGEERGQRRALSSTCLAKLGAAWLCPVFPCEACTSIEFLTDLIYDRWERTWVGVCKIDRSQDTYTWNTSVLLPASILGLSKFYDYVPRTVDVNGKS